MPIRFNLGVTKLPGVAYACEAIHDNPLMTAEYNACANLVGVVANGTAVLGLGNIGPLFSKLVMEGKAFFFKKTVGVDVFDIELKESDPDKLADIIAAMEPTFGGINLEDIKYLECFLIEAALRERMSIQELHDDQHGTATVAAAILNALTIVEKQINEVKVTLSGAGVEAIACLDLLVSMGMRKENIPVTDVEGAIYTIRPGLEVSRLAYARNTKCRTLAHAMAEADIFLGLSAVGVLKPEMLASMANSAPEILPELAREVCPYCIIGTGRSDYPNQVKNSLCIAFIFRDALDVGASTIDEKTAFPVLIVQLDMIESCISGIRLHLVPVENFEVINLHDDAHHENYWEECSSIASRSGVTKSLAREQLRNHPNLIASMLLRRGEVDAMLCGLSGEFPHNLKIIDRVIALKPGAQTYPAMPIVFVLGRQLLVCDTHVNYDPRAEQIANMTLMASEEVLHFGIVPCVALLSHSNFGSADTPSALKMRKVLKIIREVTLDLIVYGEIQADMALLKFRREREFSNSMLRGDVNILIIQILMRSMLLIARCALLQATILFGCIILGTAKPANIETPSLTARRILNTTAMAMVEAGQQ